MPPSYARIHLTRSVAFDLFILRSSLVLDILSHSLVAFHLSPSPLIFTAITSISSLAAGSTPALHSLAICILQRFREGSSEIGALFGGLSMLTALGQILGVSSSSAPGLCSSNSSVLTTLCHILDLQPLIFGTVYSTTVAGFPEAIFALAAALVLMAFGTTFFVRTEPPLVWKGKAPAVARRQVLMPERERGRSRTIKHIGDRLRKPPSASASAPSDVGTGASASMASSSRTGPGDEVV